MNISNRISLDNRGVHVFVITVSVHQGECVWCKQDNQHRTNMTNWHDTASEASISISLQINHTYFWNTQHVKISSLQCKSVMEQRDIPVNSTFYSLITCIITCIHTTCFNTDTWHLVTRYLHISLFPGPHPASIACSIAHPSHLPIKMCLCVHVHAWESASSSKPETLPPNHTASDRKLGKGHGNEAICMYHLPLICVVQTTPYHTSS